MKVYALSGGIASGKSTIARFFNEAGIPIIDADLVVHELYEKGSPIYQDIVDHFGQAILNRSGEINRKKLGALVFNDAEKRKLLESLVHPATREKISQEIKILEEKNHAFILVEAALMVESNYYKDFDGLIIVYVNQATQLNRLMQRDQINEASAVKIIESQLPLDEKLKVADFSIDNSGSLEEAKEKVTQLIKELA